MQETRWDKRQVSQDQSSEPGRWRQVVEMEQLLQWVMEGEVTPEIQAPGSRSLDGPWGSITHRALPLRPHPPPSAPHVSHPAHTPVHSILPLLQFLPFSMPSIPLDRHTHPWMSLPLCHLPRKAPTYPASHGTLSQKSHPASPGYVVTVIL